MCAPLCSAACLGWGRGLGGSDLAKSQVIIRERVIPTGGGVGGWGVGGAEKGGWRDSG